MVARTARALLILTVALMMVGTATAAPITTPILKLPAIPVFDRITSTAFSSLLAMAEVEGQVYGAGKGQLVALDSSGKITRTIGIPIEKPAGISSFTAGKAIIGDSGNSAVFSIDLKTGQAAKLLDLKATSYGSLRAGDVLKSGTLMSVAYDGKYVLVAISAGYSSSIFSIDPASNKAVAQTWAPGDSPTAMNFYGGNLYVLDAASKQIRMYDAALKLNVKPIDIQAEDPRGIIIKDNEVRVLSPKENSIVVMKPDLLSMKEVQLRPVWKMREALIGPILAMPRDYALLICGDVAESGYDEFWNDTVWLYKSLLGAGYTEDRIYVLYGDGNDYSSANPAYRHTAAVTDFPATIAWVDKVINGMKNGDASIGVSKLQSNDTLFVWVFDHGGGGAAAYFCLTDGGYADTAFGTNLNPLPYAKRAIFMQQCRSGGFIDNMMNDRTFISTACLATENAHRADTENELYNGTYYHHGEYNYYLITAISGKTPAGAAINVDYNSDGKLMAKEIHSYITSKESGPETPQQWDGYGIGNGFDVR